MHANSGTIPVPRFESCEIFGLMERNSVFQKLSQKCYFIRHWKCPEIQTGILG